MCLLAEDGSSFLICFSFRSTPTIQNCNTTAAFYTSCFAPHPSQHWFTHLPRLFSKLKCPPRLMLGSVVPAEKHRQMKGSNSFGRSAPPSLPAAKTVERRRGTETLRRDPRGCGKSFTFMAIGCGNEDLRDASRRYTMVDQYSRICEDHQFCRTDSRAIHNSNFGVTSGEIVETWRRMGLTTTTPYQLHHRSQPDSVHPSLQL